MASADIIADARERMQKSVDSTRSEFTSLRTGRANPALLDRVRETDFIWGVGLVREAPVVLVDCLKIAAACQQDGSLAGNAILNSETHAKT